MQPIASTFMRYAKQYQLSTPARYELSSSGLMGATLEDWPEPPRLELRGGHPYGHPDVIAAVSSRYGVPPEWVLPCPGTTVANLVVAVTLAGGPVAMETPGYEPLRCMLESLSDQVVSLIRQPSQQYRIDVRQVEELFKSGVRLLVITDLYNPAGTTIEEATLKKVDALASRYDGWVLVDEVYLDALEGRRPTAALLGKRLITTASLTKVYGLGSLKCGWIIAPPAVIASARGVVDSLLGGWSHPLEALGAQALASLDVFKKRYNRIQKANRSIMHRWLSAHPDIECVRPPAGLIYFLRLPATTTSESFDTLLRERYEVGIAPGHFFGDAQGIRVGIGGPSDLLEAGLDRLSEALSHVTEAADSSGPHPTVPAL